ncbi:MAG TPA: CehA/McbA family metallohydrolase [Conexibacter sp.]|nr:CehA/McbA family metallohydrolase [Conexibacter sp.]
MRELLANGPGSFFRGNLHCHSTGSDGRLSPAEVARAYREAGYDFVAITDHFEERFGWPVTDTRPFRTDEFTTIVGAELSSADWSDPSVYWVAAVGLPPGFAPPPAGDHAEAIVRASAAGAFVCLLHPGLNDLRPEAAGRLPGFDAVQAVEVYTHQSWIYRPDTAIAAPFLDALLEDGRRLTAVAGDDAHFRDGPDAFGAWVEVFARERDPDALLDGLKAGTYYSTQGPAITGLTLDGDELRVACSPCARVLLTGPSRLWRRWRWRIAPAGAPLLTEAAFTISDFRGGFCRVTAVDGDGRRAWSNPIWA